MTDKTNQYQWQKIGESFAVEHIDPKQDCCFFLMDYTPGGTYQDPEAQ